MSYQSRINTAIQRTALVLLVWCLLGANGVAATGNVRSLAIDHSAVRRLSSRTDALISRS